MQDHATIVKLPPPKIKDGGVASMNHALNRERRLGTMEEKKEKSYKEEDGGSSSVNRTMISSHQDSMDSSAMMENVLLQPIPVSMEVNNALDVSVKSSSVWRSDDTVDVCSQCSSEFHPLNRKHHCRLCGQIFCHSCSSKRALIPPSSIVLTPLGGKKVASTDRASGQVSFEANADPDRTLTYTSKTGNNPVSSTTDTDNTTGEYGELQETDHQVGSIAQSHSEVNAEEGRLLYGKGLEERTKLAREPLRVCNGCHDQLQYVQEELRNCNSNAMRFNAIDPSDVRRLFNSPLAFTLGHEVRKAAYTLNNLLPLPKRMGALMMPQTILDTTGAASAYSVAGPQSEHCRDTCTTISSNFQHMDGVRIPARLLEQAKGVAVLTVVKGGFGFAGFEFGTGLVVARLPGDNEWSAPCAIGTAGCSFGALVGAQVSDHVFLLMTDEAVDIMSCNDGSFQLGADIGVAAGPLGRSVEADAGIIQGKLTPIYTYSLSKGFYAGASLDGKVIITRHHVNEKFYGTKIDAKALLSGQCPTPPAAQPLYNALRRCHQYASLNKNNSNIINSNTNIHNNNFLSNNTHYRHHNTITSQPNFEQQSPHHLMTNY